MIYIHSYKDFNGKNAEIESVPIIREIKAKTPLPITAQKLSEHLGAAFPTRDDIDVLQSLQPYLDQLILDVKSLLAMRNELYEDISLNRTIAMLDEVRGPLPNTIAYFSEMYVYSSEFFDTFAAILDSLPRLRTQQEKLAANAALNDCFAKILRTKEFVFNGYDIINDNNTKSMLALQEALSQGFLFKVRLEEHVAKLGWEKIRARIPAHELAIVDDIQHRSLQVKIAVDNAYERCMQLIYLATYMYAYIKWLHG